jgi:hypothetical protein
MAKEPGRNIHDSENSDADLLPCALSTLRSRLSTLRSSYCGGRAAEDGRLAAKQAFYKGLEPIMGIDHTHSAPIYSGLTNI